MSAHSVAVGFVFEGLLALAGKKSIINGTEYDSHVTQLTEEEVFVLGGKAESGGLSVWVRPADMPTLPSVGDPIIARGKTLQFKSSETVDGHIELFAVDLASEQ